MNAPRNRHSEFKERELDLQENLVQEGLRTFGRVESSNRQLALADQGRFAGPFYRHPENNLANRENHLAAEGGDAVCRGGGGMKRTS